MKKLTTVKELAEYLNSLEIQSNSSDWAECLPDNIWDEYFNAKFIKVASGLDVDKHRWYETSITVIKILDGFMGINFATDLFSESMKWEDTGVTLSFSEMEEVNVVSYRNKV